MIKLIQRRACYKIKEIEVAISTFCAHKGYGWTAHGTAQHAKSCFEYV